MNKKITWAVLALSVFILSFHYIMIYSATPPASRTGAPGELTCVSCHGSFALNSGTGNISFLLSGSVNCYMIDSTYTVTVEVTDPTRVEFGFEITALDSNNNMAGSFIVTNAANTTFLTGIGRQYISHKSSGSNNVWLFDWTAPSSNIGPISFYIAGNAANGNGSTSGDYIYTDTFSIAPPLTAFAGNDTIICGGAGATIGGSPTATGGTGPFTYLWSPLTGLNNTSIANPLASPTSTTSYTVTVTDANGCSDTDIITVTNNLTANAGGDVTMCDGDSTAIGGSPTATGGTGPFTYLWSPATGLNSSTIANPTATPTSTTGYSLTITDANTCNDTDTITVTVSPIPTADAGSDTVICNGDSTSIGGSPTATGGTGPYTYLWSPAIALNDTTIANPVTSPASTTSYSLTITDGNSCTNTDTVTITVNPIPTADVGPDTIICQCTSVFINGNASNGTVSWSDQGAGGVFNIPNIENPDYTPPCNSTGIICLIMTVTDTSGLCGSASDTVCITINPIPTANFGFTDSVLTVSFSDSSLNAATWFWDFGDGDTSILTNPKHTYSTDGTFRVCLIVVNACGSDTSCDSVTVLFTDIQMNNLQNSIKIYPNPASGQLFIRISNTGSQTIDIAIVDVMGKVVIRKEMEPYFGTIQESIDISELASRIYFLRISYNDRVEVKKIVVY
ncbi:MAG: T9SS type A sorting domain-containing protein [Bacteroidetes bacterium]|nr:T9SS type A sorting domain-containing protein [Bacteroidota bacterium]